MRKTKRNIKVDIFAICIVAVALISGSCKKQAEAPEKVTVFAAASTTNAIMEISREFTGMTGIEVITNFASSSTLAQQIEAGAEADVYISANQKWADYLEERELCESRETILGNRIVIVVPKESLISGNSAEILMDEGIKNIAMGDPSHVPAGRYGKEALVKLNLWDKISEKVTGAKDVRSALVYVETEAAEAGIVYSTDAAISEKVKVVYVFPEDATARVISYPAIILKDSGDLASAEKFFEYLRGEAAKAVFIKYGFIAK